MAGGRSFIDAHFRVDASRIPHVTWVHFVTNIALDVAIIIASYIIWRYLLWVPIHKLAVPIVRRNRIPHRRIVGQDSFKYLLTVNSSMTKAFRLIRRLIKQMIGLGEHIIVKQYGFEYYTYLFFLRRISLLLCIIIITDLCVWLPYMLIIRPIQQFSLITMPSPENDQFRVFYTIWVSSVLVYGLHDMKKHLHVKLIHRNFKAVDPTDRQGSYQKHLLNNLKSKTIHIQFSDGHFSDVGSVKAQVQLMLVQQFELEDAIVAVQTVQPYHDLLQAEYHLKVSQIIQQYGVQNFSPLWQLLKQQNSETIRQQHVQAIATMNRTIQQIKQEAQIKGCFIAVLHMKTAQKLCNQFEIQKALTSFCPQFTGQDDAEWNVAGSKMIVRWAQDPKDIVWANIGQHQKQIIRHLLFNTLCVILLILSFFFIALTSTNEYINMPQIIGPAVLVLVNMVLRVIISKMVQFQRKIMKSQWHIKQYNITIIYFLINVILASIVKDTLNLISLLQTGWGWIQLFGLVFQQADGLFYYIFIFNQIALSSAVTFIKPSQIFKDIFEADFYYEKARRVKRKTMYGKNHSYKLGYAYSMAFITLAVVIIYSVSCPLIHIFGLLYFIARLYMDTFTIVVFHEQQMNSNLRFIAEVIKSIVSFIAFWIFLTATSMIFTKDYSNAMVLYVFCGVILYYASISDKDNSASQYNSLRDQRTDQLVRSQDISRVIDMWKREYMHPFDDLAYKFTNSSRVVHLNKKRSLRAVMQFAMRPRS